MLSLAYILILCCMSVVLFNNIAIGARDIQIRKFRAAREVIAGRETAESAARGAGLTGRRAISAAQVEDEVRRQKQAEETKRKGTTFFRRKPSSNVEIKFFTSRGIPVRGRIDTKVIVPRGAVANPSANITRTTRRSPLTPAQKRTISKPAIQKEIRATQILTAAEVGKKPVRPKGVLRAAPPKTARQKIIESEQKQLLALQRKKAGVTEKVFRGTAALGLIGVAKGGLGIIQLFTNPLATAKGIVQAAKTPIQTLRVTGQQFVINPVGTVAEFITFSKGLNAVGRLGTRSPVGRFVKEEGFIRSQPKEIRGAVRKIIKSAKVQEKLNPTKTRIPKSVDFVEVKSLTKIEAAALKKTLQTTDSVVFGSLASRTISRKKTPLPKDVDIATKNIIEFSNKFIQNLPKSQRSNFRIKGQKVVRLSNGEALFDIKPIGRLIPQRSILTRRGFLPVSGFVKKIGLKKGSLLPEFKKKIVGGVLEVPTQKLVKIGGIKLVGFGEQTLRKALGTLQVLIEKEARRAKDPQAFLISLEVQVGALKSAKPKTPIGRLRNARRIKVLEDAISLLKSKGFARLLERKVKSLTKDFPLVSKINPKKLRKINLAFVRRRAKVRIAKKIIIKPRLTPRIKKALAKRRIVKRKKVVKKPSKLPKKRPSRLPSKLPKKRPSRLPSKVPSKIPKRPSRLPSKIPPSKVPSVLLKPPSKIPVSKLPAQISALRSFLRKAPKSQIPFVQSKLKAAIIKRRKALRKVTKIIKKEVESKEKKFRRRGKTVRKFVFSPDIAALLNNVKATPKERRLLLKKGRIFTGLERRKIV